MENIYNLSARMSEIAARYDQAQTALEEAMEENGGELTEETGQMLEELEQLEAIKADIALEFVKFPDEYAAWYKNEEARRDAVKAERKAYEDHMKAVLAKYDARIKRHDSRMAWIRENINGAMVIANVEKFDKKRPGAMFSIYYQSSSSIDVDEAMALEPYQDIIKTVSAQCPEWLSFEPKIAKKVLAKTEELPQGFERKKSRTLVIK